MTQPWGYRSDVDGLRAIAILLVLGFHAFPLVVPGGFVGVDVFFVISGYLISGIIFSSLIAGRFSLGLFYAGRIRRILPALILVLVCCLAFGWWTLLSNDYSDLGRHSAGAAAFLSNVLLWYQTGYFDQAAELKSLLHLWSLGIEQQFYLWWPPVVVLAWRRGWPVSLPLLTVGTVTLAASILLTPQHPAGSFYLPVTRMWELLIGSGLAAAEVLRPQALRWIQERSMIREAASLLGATLVVASAFAISGAGQFPGWLALFPTIGTALVLAAGPASLLSRKFLALPVMVFVGLISFPLYLWHWPLLVFARLLSVNASTRVTWILLAVSVALASATYLLVEKPLRSRTRPSALQAVSLLALLALVGGAGWLTMAEDGFPSRHPELAPRTLVAQVAQFRTGTCFRNPYRDVLEYPAECDENTGSASILLIGDSIAAQLYSSLAGPVHERNVDLIQYTVSDCRPTAAEPDCVRFYSGIRSRLASRKPTVVLIAAGWRAEDVALLPALIRDYSSTGARVMIVGPTPLWVGQPMLQVKLTNAAKQGSLLVQRIDPNAKTSAQLVGFDTTQASLDEAISQTAKSAHAQYFSAYRVLCPGGECLATADGTLRGLMYIDRKHLTEVGARLLVEKLIPDDSCRVPSPRCFAGIVF